MNREAFLAAVKAAGVVGEGGAGSGRAAEAGLLVASTVIPRPADAFFSQVL